MCRARFAKKGHQSCQFLIALFLCLSVSASTGGSGDGGGAVSEEGLLASNSTGVAVLHPGTGAARNWSWPLPCLETRDEVFARADAHWLDIIPRDAALFRTRGARYACFRTAKVPCFRAIYDGFLQGGRVGELVEALGAPSVNGIMRETADLPPPVNAVVGDIIALFEARHGIAGLRLVQANYIAYDAGPGAALPLHVDYHYAEHSHFAYSALLYLSSASVEDGGATAFTDVPRGSKRDWEVGKGLIVQPASGRLSVFSSGAENVHAGRDLQRSVAEQRKVLALWFNCSDTGGDEVATTTTDNYHAVEL